MNFVEPIIQGTITGIVLTLSFGAGFFALIQTSILRGYKKGMLIALGAIISDTIFIAISIFATSFVSEELPKYARTFKLVALVAFIFLGVRTILKSSKIINTSDKEGRPNYFYITKGFLLNVVNPLVMITWLGITLFLESTLHYGNIELSIYFLSVLVSTLLVQSAICIFSYKIKNYLSDLFIHRLNIFIGILFIALGLFLFFGNNDSGEGMEKAKDLLN
jgi:threonine/homoserine/homoserine lactone efflux protein